MTKTSPMMINGENMSGVLRNQKVIETNLHSGVSLVSVLLRLGYYNEAAYLASQLLVHFPQALPLHVGVGRALLANLEQPDDVQRAVGHLRRVLDADPDNWRVRLELVMLYRRAGGKALQQRANQELALVLQLAPDIPWIYRMLDRLRADSLDGYDPTPAVFTENKLPKEDDGTLARLYLRRKMPWMSVHYFELALEQHDEPARTDLKTGLLLALWLNAENRRASSYARQILLDQPQLILPRLLLTSHLAATSMSKEHDRLIHLIEPVWRVDPFLERTLELTKGAGIVLPAGLISPYNNESPVRERWEKLGFTAPLRLQLGELDPAWLSELGETYDKPGLELNYGLDELENVRSQTSYSLGIFPVKAKVTTNVRKGAQELPDIKKQRPKELDDIATSIAHVENLLYGERNNRKSTNNRSSRMSASPASTAKSRLSNDSQRRTRRGPSPKGGSKEASSSVKNGGSQSSISDDITQQVKQDYTASAREKLNEQGLKQTTTLIVSSEQALTTKYGAGGFRRVYVLLQQLAETLINSGKAARLLLVDSSEGLRRNGFERLDPVDASQPEQVRNIINAALPFDSSDTVFDNSITVLIIGGPQIIPFWKLPNPTFDSDREVLSDNPYGTRDYTYLLPERILGRLPDADGQSAEANLEFLVSNLRTMIARHQGLTARTQAHTALSSLPMRLLENILPGQLRSTLEASNQLYPPSFEQDWLQEMLDSGDYLLTPSTSKLLAPFFYSAEAWKSSTETLKTLMGAVNSRIISSPPTHADEFEPEWMQRARLLHFNLHGFRDTSNWYGQSHASRIVTSPSLNSLPVAFSPALASHLQMSGTVVFSEACYGGYLPGKGVDDSIALSLLAQGSAVFVGSSVISYGNAGPELSCAGYLSYHFWREVLKQGSSFGQALQTARINYARERLAAGHNLTGDDAKTLLEFVLLGDPMLGMRVTSPTTAFLSIGSSSSPNLMKGSIFGPGHHLWDEEIEQKIRKSARQMWGRFAKPQPQYQPVQYEKLPNDLKERVEKILAWLLPDPVQPEGEYLQTLIDISGDYNPRRSTSLYSRHQKGGDPTAFADWLGEDGNPGFDNNSKPNYQPVEAQLLLAGKRPLLTADGHNYAQTFHLLTDVTGTQINVNLSKGRG